MSDMLNPGQIPGQIPGQAPGQNANPIRDNLSAANPTDAAYMGQTGMLRKGMTMKEYMETTFKLPITSPVEAFAEAIKKQQAGRTPLGKMGTLAQGGQSMRRPGEQRPSVPPTQGRRPLVQPQPAGGLEGTMSRVGGV